MTPLREWGLRRTPTFGLGHCGFWSPGFRWVFSAVISPWALSQTLPFSASRKERLLTQNSSHKSRSRETARGRPAHLLQESTVY